MYKNKQRKLFKDEILLDGTGGFIKFNQDIYIGENALLLSKVLKTQNI